MISTEFIEMIEADAQRSGEEEPLTPS